MEITLGGKKGGILLVSEIDFELVSKYKWHQTKHGYVRGCVNGKNVGINRFIMNPKRNEEVDHINKNKLDNKRENLRVLIPIKNKENQGKRVNATCKYMGVYYKKEQKKYEAIINHGGKRHHIGYFDLELVAAEKRDIYIIKNKLDHIQLNFPEKKDDYAKTEFHINKRNKTSNYIGVAKIYGNKFKATICVNRKDICIGITNDEIECAKMYDRYIIENNIPRKKLNYPNDNYCKNITIKTLCEPIDDNTVRLIIKNKENEFVQIDKNDYELVKFYSCSIDGNHGVRIYRDKMDSLHRIIMDVNDPNIFIDHIDGNVLNNTRKNLRLSDCNKNAQNKSKTKNKTTSKYIGICYKKRDQKWYGSICIKYKNIYNKSDINEIYSARRRDIYIMENLKDMHFKLNFEWTENEISEWKNKLSY